MGKRKATAPQARLGRVEDRQAPEDRHAQHVEEEEELFLAEEEAAEAEEQRKRRACAKRMRKAAAARTGAGQAGQVALVPAAPWCFATLNFESAVGVGPEETAASGSMRLEVAGSASTDDRGKRVIEEEEEEESDGFSLLRIASSAGWRATARLPSVAADALQRLLQSGHLSAAAAVSSAPPDGSAASNTIITGLRLSLTAKAAAEAVSWPEEVRQRVWQRQLLAVLQWKQPELDPERELLLQQAAHEPRAEALLRSPLCSPRGAGKQATAFAPGSPMAAAAAAAQLSPSPGSPRGLAPSSFDAAELYAAVKPTGREPELEQEAVGDALLPALRHYQRRAALWMIRREKGVQGGTGSAQQQEQQRGNEQLGWQQGPHSSAKGEEEEGHPTGAEASTADTLAPLHPLWREVRCAGAGVGSDDQGEESHAPCFYVNPWSGAVALERFSAPREVQGGILSEEMGLGKTVELLACIASHRYEGPAPVFPKASKHKRARRQERVDCVCGADSDDEGYEGLWVQCDECLAWLHCACVGLRRAPAGEWVCGACLRQSAAAEVTQPCGATLVVCPAPILHQWHDEILRHIRPGNLKVAIYEGQPQPGAGAGSARAGGRCVTTAAELASCDIVLTTYDVLRRDVNHCPDGGSDGVQLRRRKRYEVIPTPLTRLRWWRVALDEAQMVESSTAKAAEMALKLQTEHHWCVTGTPLSRGLEDLFGLFAFLQAAPYDSRAWFQRVLQQPYEAGSAAARARLLGLLRPALGGLLWRSSKADVADELGLPPQHHHLTRLQDTIGSARAAIAPDVLAAAMRVNQELVDLTAEAEAGGDGDAAAHGAAGTSAAGASAAAATAPAARAAAAAAAQFENRPLTEREEQRLLQPLLRLRQACCHPQASGRVGGGGIKAGQHGGGSHHQRAPMSMGEILEVMIAKTKVEAEDQQRILLSSLNGIAGLLLLQGKQAEAVATYRQALATMEAHQSLVRTDALQQLHTLHNLGELLAGPGARPAGVAPTLRDAELARQAAALRDEYMAEAVARLAGAEAELREVQGQLARVVREAALAGVKPKEREASIAGKFNDLFGLEVVLQHEFRQGAAAVAACSVPCHLLGPDADLLQLRRAQEAALAELAALGKEVDSPSPQLVELAASCSRCRAETAVAGRVCRHCRLEDLFLRWEGRAFQLSAKAAAPGAAVSAEDALLQARAQQQDMAVGRGGLGEHGVQGGGGAGAEGARHAGGVTRTEIVRHPGDAEAALRQLTHQLRLLKPAAQGSGGSGGGDAAARLAAHKALLLAAAKAQLELLEGGRRLYLKARALSGAQREKLYSLDELGQSTMRLQLVAPGEWVTPQEEVYKRHPEEVPVRSVELSNEKAAAEADLHMKLGTLRYLLTLRRKEEARRAAAEAAAAADAAQQEQQGEQQQQQQEQGQGVAEGREQELQQAQPRGAGLHGACSSATVAPAAAPAAGASAQGQEDEEDSCAICLQAMGGTELVMLPCGHHYHTRCWMEQLPKQARVGLLVPPDSRKPCPVCRTRVLLSEVAFVDTCAAAGATAGAGGQQQGGAEGALAVEEGRIRVAGSFGTKLEAVVRRLAYLTRADPSARVLVFSTWKDVLVLLAHALAANGLPHLYPKCGGKRFEAAVAEFRSGHAEALAAAKRQAQEEAGPRSGARRAGTRSATPPAGPRILLLLIKQGGNGLNLTAAQHVVLVEPLLDPAAEAQAVGRVDRIGQKRETHVHRFVIEETIEENVHKLCQARAAAMDLSAASVKRSAGARERGSLTLLDVALLLREGGGRVMQEEEEEAAAAVADETEGGAGQGAAAGPSARHAAEALSPRQCAAAAALARAAVQVPRAL
eukprot:scaffold6.g2685.t1